MKSKNKISFLTKLLSNRHYLKEVPVEGKRSHRFFFLWGWYDLYASQIIRTGNCITLLSNPYSLTVDSFWNINYFEDITKYIFWTFNKSFRLKLVSSIAALPVSVVSHTLSLLNESPNPYSEALESITDEELQWCYKKIGYLKKDDKFESVFQLDQENRAAIKEALERKLNGDTAQEQSIPFTPAEATNATFLEMLRPVINGSPLETIKFMDERTKEAGIKFDLFRPVTRLANGSNPYGFNGAAGAMIELFYDKNYFKASFSKEDVFRAYLNYTGNKIGRFNSFYADFKDDNYFKRYFAKLNAIEIKEFKD